MVKELFGKSSRDESFIAGNLRTKFPRKNEPLKEKTRIEKSPKMWRKKSCQEKKV